MCVQLLLNCFDCCCIYTVLWVTFWFVPYEGLLKRIMWHQVRSTVAGRWFHWNTLSHKVLDMAIWGHFDSFPPHEGWHFWHIKKKFLDLPSYLENISRFVLSAANVLDLPTYQEHEPRFVVCVLDMSKSTRYDIKTILDMTPLIWQS